MRTNKRRSHDVAQALAELDVLSKRPQTPPPDDAGAASAGPDNGNEQISRDPVTPCTEPAGEERPASAVLANLLRSRKAAPALFAKIGWPAIVSWKRDVPVQHGRANFRDLPYECLAGDRSGRRQRCATGCGPCDPPVMAYAAQLDRIGGSVLSRGVLAATASDDAVCEFTIEELCESAGQSAGVEYFPVGPTEKHLPTLQATVVSAPRKCADIQRKRANSGRR
jgi:hypothetical protein